MNAPPFCAVCTSEQGPFVERPLGKGNAPVLVCKACDEEHPRQGRYAFEGNESPNLYGSMWIGRGARKGAP